jgi:hypothetical protein
MRSASRFVRFKQRELFPLFSAITWVGRRRGRPQRLVFSVFGARDQAIVELRREKLQKETAEKPQRGNAGGYLPGFNRASIDRCGGQSTHFGTKCA